MARLRNPVKSYDQFLGEGRIYSRSMARLYLDDSKPFGPIAAETAAGNVTISDEGYSDGQWSGYITATAVGEAKIVLKGASAGNAEPYIAVFRVNVIDPADC